MAPTVVYFYLSSILIAPISVSGYYCKGDWCGLDQYCCGENMCCDYVYSLWYFWIGVVFIIIVLSACGGFFRYCYYYNPQIVVHRINNYSPMVNDVEKPENNYSKDDVPLYPGYQSVSAAYSANLGPPPPYSQNTTNHPVYKE